MSENNTVKSIFDPIEETIEEIKKGKMVILVDDEDRENEGDLVCAAECVTPEIINFMARYARGLICLALDSAKVRKLQLPLMVPDNEAPFGSNFTVSIEAASGVTTGISAADRARTVQVAMAPDAEFFHLRKPGHIFPLEAKDGGVLVRAGHTEGSVDLSRLAGMRPGGVICEIMNDDGTMARYPELREFADKHQLKMSTIADLIKFRKRNEVLVEKVAEANLPTEYGEFKMVGFKSLIDDNDFVALIKGSWEEYEPVLVRVHSQCLTGDVFGSFRCDCGDQLHEAMKRIESEGKGVIVYLPQEGRGIGLINKIKAYHLQDRGADTVEANWELGFKDDLREYGMGAQILSYLNIRKMRLLTNNPRKIVGLEGHNLEVIDRIQLQMETHAHNQKYLKTKKEKLGHLLNL